MKYSPKDVFSSILKSQEPLDSGLDAVVSRLYSSVEDSESLTQDLATLLSQRNRLTAAEVELESFIYFGSVPAIRNFTTYLHRNRGDLQSGKNAELKCRYVDFIRRCVTKNKDKIKADFPDRQLHADELSAVFEALERLCSCGVLIDCDLLSLLATALHDKYGSPAYALIRRYGRFYGEYRSRDDVSTICRLRHELIEEGNKLVALNKDLWPLIRYLLAVSYAKSYLFAGDSSSPCSKCVPTYFDEEASLSSTLTRMELEKSQPYFEDKHYDCSRCPDIPSGMAEESFTTSVLENMYRDSFLPAARLFWDIHDTRPISYFKRMDIASATASCRDIYDLARPPHPIISSSFVEKT